MVNSRLEDVSSTNETSPEMKTDVDPETDAIVLALTWDKELGAPDFSNEIFKKEELLRYKEKAKEFIAQKKRDLDLQISALQMMQEQMKGLVDIKLQEFDEKEIARVRGELKNM